MKAIRAVAQALDGWADYALRWRGGELDRVISARHAALHQAFSRWLAGVGGWEIAPEVSFSIYGERGIIDALGWHDQTRTLLVVELKTELVDISELLGTFDRKLRLGARVAADRGWGPQVVAGWLLVTEGRTNRRRLAEHRDVLRAALPSDGRQIDGWLHRPSGPFRALSFLPKRHLAGLSLRLDPQRRVRPRNRARPRAPCVAIPSGAAGTAGPRPRAAG